MQSDYMLVFGALAILASALALVNAFSRGDKPGVWGVMLIAGVGLVSVAVATNPMGYTSENIQQVFVRVFTSLFA